MTLTDIELTKKYDDDERAAALAKMLDDDTVTITASTYDDCEYEVDAGTKKEGQKPSEIVQDMKDLHALLTPGITKEIDAYLALLDTLDGAQSETVRKKLYDKGAASIAELGKIGGNARDAYDRLTTSHLYAENILYNLLALSGTNSYESETTIQYRKDLRAAWGGKTPKDHRKTVDTNGGEYLVLTDSEADSRAEDSADNLIDDMLHDVPEHLQNYFDRERFISDNIDRASELGRYDGSENEQDINGTTYYIYRTN